MRASLDSSVSGGVVRSIMGEASKDCFIPLVPAPVLNGITVKNQRLVDSTISELKAGEGEQLLCVVCSSDCHGDNVYTK